MFNTNETQEFFLSCPIHLEEALIEEVPQDLKPNLASGGVKVETTIEQMLPVILRTRIASRSYIKLCEEKVYHEKDFYKLGKKIDWHKVLNLKQTFKINVVQTKLDKKRSKFKNAQFLGQVFKDGLVDRYRKEAGDERPSVDKTFPDLTILINIRPTKDTFSEIAEVYIDPIGRPLGNRGYRSERFDGSLRENLAAGILSIINPSPAQPFHDFMCGSGTVVIEEAMRRLDLPPSYIFLSQKSKLSIEKLLCFSDDVKKFVKDLRYQILKDVDQKISSKKTNFAPILASDIDDNAVKITRKHLRRTGLDFAVQVERQDALKLKSAKDSAYFANVPYGIRLDAGTDTKLEDLYHKIGEHFKNELKGSDLYLFTANRELIKKIRLQTSMKRILNNSNLEARLVHYKLY